MVFHLKLVPKKKEPARLKAKGFEEKALVKETAAQINKEAVPEESLGTSTSVHKDAEGVLTDDDDELDIDELNELEATLSKTPIQIRVPGMEPSS